MEDVGDVFGAVGVEFDGVFDGAGGGFFAVDFAERDDFSDVDGGVEPSVLKLPDVFVGVRAEAHEVFEVLLVAGFAFLLEEFALVVGVEVVDPSVVIAEVFGDEVVFVIDEELVWVGSQEDAFGGVFGGDGVGVGFVGDAELGVDGDGATHADVVGNQRQRQEFGTFFFEHLDGLFMRGSVDARVGDGVEPDARSGVDGIKAVALESVEKILFDVADSIFNPSFFVRCSDVAGGDLKAVVVGEVDILRMKNGLFSQ